VPKTDIKLYSTEPSGKATTATISDVNPEATNAQLKTLGQMLNSFTRNRYDKTNRINTIQCDTEEGGGKLTPTFTLEKTTDTKANVCKSVNGFVSYHFGYTYDGDGQIFIHNDDTTGDLGFLLYQQGHMIYICACNSPTHAADSITQDATITLYATETDNYKAAEATFTITA